MNYILQKDYIDPDNFITRSGAKVHKCDTFYFADGGQTFTSDFVENNTEWFKPEEVERTTEMSQEPKKYILLKDLHFCKAGAIFTQEKGDENYYNTNGAMSMDRIHWSRMANEEWFKLKESKPIEIHPLEKEYDTETIKRVKFIIQHKEKKPYFYGCLCQEVVSSMGEDTQRDLLKYFGVQTNQPDSECYKAPKETIWKQFLNELNKELAKEMEGCGCFTTRSPGGETRIHCDLHPLKHQDDPEPVRFSKWLNQNYVFLSVKLWQKIDLSLGLYNTNELYTVFKEQNK